MSCLFSRGCHICPMFQTVSIILHVYQSMSSVLSMFHSVSGVFCAFHSVSSSCMCSRVCQMPCVCVFSTVCQAPAYVPQCPVTQVCCAVCSRACMMMELRRRGVSCCLAVCHCRWPVTSVWTASWECGRAPSGGSTPTTSCLPRPTSPTSDSVLR